MNEQDLDIAYTAVCRALGEVGPAHAERFLAMLCLGLLVRSDDAQAVLALVESVKARCADGGPGVR